MKIFFLNFSLVVDVWDQESCGSDVGVGFGVKNKMDDSFVLDGCVMD